ncbi:MAG: uroporphyrinogen-III C-methyltransferase [Thermoplasmata archaeon]
MNKVYLIGAGPGDPTLITIKGMNALEKSDVILYDSLVSTTLLKKLPKNIKKINVGKIKGKDTDVMQENIHELIKKYYNEGKNVSRLKGGDPFLFGRGGEEIEFMKKENIKYEVIPGITSAIGVPTNVGLPLTHRDVSSSVMIVSAHLKDNYEPDWKSMATFNGTLVILMGVSKIGDIKKHLIYNGMNDETPFCIIQNGTTKKQKIVNGKIKSMVDIAKKNDIKAPAVIVIGKVVNFIV